MPALPAVANVVLVRVKGTYGGQPWNAIFHLQYSGGAPTVADLNSIGTSIGTAWSANLASLHVAGVIVTGVDLADLTSQAAATTTVTLNIPGTRAGTNFPSSVATVVSWNINRRYRGGHPRTYFPFGVVADALTVRTWTTAFTTAVQTGANAFRTALNALSVSGTTYKMVCVSYILDHEIRTTPIPFTITGNVTHGRIDTQRRRLGKETP